MDLNKVMIIGRLTRDPEIRTTPQGANVCSFGVATNLIWTNQQGQKQEKVEFHNIVMWRRLAEIASQYLNKGKKIYIEGRLQTREWQGQDGVRRQRTEIVADNMIMLDGGQRGAVPGAPNFQTAPQASAAPSENVSGNVNTTPSVPGEPTVEPISPQAAPQPAKTTTPVVPAAAIPQKKEGVSVEDIPF